MARAPHPRLERAFRTSWRWVCVVGLLTGLSVSVARAEGPPSGKANISPWVSLKLSDLGVPPIPQAFMNVGSSMLTLNVIDDTHLLVTYSTRGLVPRLPDDPPDDDDRMVAAEVVELPKGEVLARTEWHMHDHGRYLWRLGKGRFLVRSRNQLYLITPGALLNTANPFRPTPFPSRSGIPATALSSPDASLITVETLVSPPKKQDASITNGDEAEATKSPVLIDFYRLKGGVEEQPEISVIRAGAVKSPAVLAIPLDGDGYLWPGDQKRGKWPVTFNQMDGKTVPVGTVLSSCPPRLQLVSRSEYIAFACQGSEERLKMEAFGMDGHETWEEPIGSANGLPTFVFAPQAGRFAISRMGTVVPDPEGLAVVPDGATQEIRVYQTESGDLLLRAPLTPVMKTAENFDLSDDGMVAAVVNAGAVQVYKLPPLSDTDQKDLKMAQGFSPPLGDGPVNLARLAKAQPGRAAEAVESAESAEPPAKPEMKPAVDNGTPPAKTDVASSTPPPEPAKADVAGSASAPARMNEAGHAGSGQASAPADKPAATVPEDSGAGDSDPAGPRKPPTLLSPGEAAEYHPGGSAKNEKSQ